MTLCIKCEELGKETEATFPWPGDYCDYHYCEWWCEGAFPDDPEKQAKFFHQTLLSIKRDTAKLNRMYTKQPEVEWTVPGQGSGDD